MSDNQILKAALWYSEKMGYSIIPVKGKSGHLIKWAKYQDEKATKEQIEKWWDEWPDANIAIVTGKISGITVFDIDSYKLDDTQKAELDKAFPVVATPTVISAGGGEHRYFEYSEAVSNTTDIMTGLDIKNNGGLIVAPPSMNGGKQYLWKKNAKILEMSLRAIPASYISSINSINALYIGGVDKSGVSTQSTLSTMSTLTLNFNEGSRDQTLFHIANCLTKGGMNEENIKQFLILINDKLCLPPMKQSEVLVKLQSALKRDNTQSSNFTQSIRDIICQHSGIISSTFIQQMTTLSTREEKKKLATVLKRLEAEELIKKTKKRAGEYWIIDNQVDISNINDVEDEQPINIKLPFGLDEYVNIMRGNLIIVCGVTNVGKSAILLEMVRLNMKKHKCTYFSSEMSKSLIKRRISLHEDQEDWDFSVVDAWDNNFDVLRKDELNFIDWIEEEEAWRVKARLTDVQSAIGKGIGIVALQKNPNSDMPWGGPQTLNKSALAFTIDFIDPESYRKGVRMRIKKCKEPKTENPFGWIVEYKTYNGINFFINYGWGPEMSKKYNGLVK